MPTTSTFLYKYQFDIGKHFGMTLRQHGMFQFDRCGTLAYQHQGKVISTDYLLDATFLGYPQMCIFLQIRYVLNACMWKQLHLRIVASY